LVLSSVSPLIKFSIGLWIVLTAALAAAVVMHYRNNAGTARIVLHLTDALLKLDLKFGVLHVRDGKDEVRDSGPILNEEIPFKAIDRHGTMEATIRYRKTLGFQFKCFVDYSGAYDDDKLEQLLKGAKFSNISKGQGPIHRIFFILDEYPVYDTIDKFTNNYFYPA
jgi:hypothetical protein